MNTTMMNPPRRILTPGASNKRKEREGLDPLKPSTANKLAKPSGPRPATPTNQKASEPASSNQLLAGYLAHEFLTKGTLFGQLWDTARAEAMHLSADSAESRRMKSFSQKPSVKPEAQVVEEKYQRYVEIANLLKRDGAHLPGTVNPTQLARFLQL